MAKIVVTGAMGLLGSKLTPHLKKQGHAVTRLSHTQAAEVNADITSYEQVACALDQTVPEVIINLVALTNVDRCESHPQEAYLLNVRAVENLTAWITAATHHCHLIQISSDHVYDGTGPHEEDQVTIRNHYAMSKLAGELAARTIPSTILRTNFIGRSNCEGRISLTDWLHSALNGTDSINVFDDVMFSPLAINTLCHCIERCVVEKPLGVFNLGSHDGMSKADFAYAFASAAGLSTANILRRKIIDVDELVAPRPRDMRMNCKNYELRMNQSLPRLIDEIQLIAKEYCK